MLLFSLYLAIFVLQFASSFAFDYSCDPLYDCNINNFGSKVPDPEDCHNYYICLNSDGESVPSDVPIACPDGEFFDQIYGGCLTESEPCTNECYKFCNLECATDFQLVAFPGDCSKYYICYTTGDTKVEMNCPQSNPYFNGTECSSNPYLCCDSCIPYCTEIFKEIEDPLDCHSFYICIEVGIPSEEYHGKCSDGEHFDSDTNLCTSGGDCSSICGDITTTTVRTSTASVTATTFQTGPAILI